MPTTPHTFTYRLILKKWSTVRPNPPSAATVRYKTAIYVSGGRCTWIHIEVKVLLSPHRDVHAQTTPNFAHLNNIDVIPTLVFKPVFDKDPPNTLPPSLSVNS